MPALNITQLPNPTTPMAFVPPDLAQQVMTVSWISVGSAAVSPYVLEDIHKICHYANEAVKVLLWDMWDNICSDYRLVTAFTIQLPTIVYFLSRYAEYSGQRILYSPAALTWDCPRFEKIISIGFPIAVSCTSFLFLLRFKAIFNGNKYIVALFICLWIAVVLSTLTGIFGISGVNIGPTEYCATDRFENYVAAAVIVPLVYDTMVFVAISWRLMKEFLVEDPAIHTISGVKALVFGDYLPAFSRSLLQDGQVYYLTTITTGLTAVIILFIPGIPSHVTRTMLTVPNLTLMNIMACRVFRKTKFGMFREASLSTSRLFIPTKEENGELSMPPVVGDATQRESQAISARKTTPDDSLDTLTEL
ncbi:hypothetical protein CVT24_008464 [Panaeolus cyanescens]|uniref:G-protein coupled receptors family 1 profile domain-containing protein n=1 Tax=Panaeolus cyanescens TaxID=181874 RepID=A0A409VBR3_9AGAR|nr:hypothetical protein CVT24_008464 [Panaeolus cyanescens]